MKRRGFLKNLGAIVGAFFLGETLEGCSKGGIDTTLGPDNNQISEKTLVKYLNTQPYATWSPYGNDILFSKDENIWIKQNNSKPYELIISPDKTASHPNWEKNTIAFQLNYLNENKSEIFASSILPGFAIYPKKLNFDLREGKYEFPTLSPDTNYIAFSFNNDMYISEYPPTGKATNIPVSEIIHDYSEEVKMYSWSRDGEKIAFTAKTSKGTNIYVMDDIPSRRICRLTEGNFHYFNPSFSYDNNLIAFDSNRFSTANKSTDADNVEELVKHSICYVRNDDKNLEKLSEGSGISPKFNPNTNELLYCFKTADGMWEIKLNHDLI